MIEWLTGIFTGIGAFIFAVATSWIFLIAMFFFAVLSEKAERVGWGVFCGILILFSAYHIFGIAALSSFGYWTLGGIYVAGGVIHSLWRWFRSTAILTEKFNAQIAGKSEDQISDYLIRDYKDNTNFRANMDKITYWIAAWPISGAAHLLGDVVVLIQEAVTKFFAGIFDKITERARGKAAIDVSKY